MNTLTYQANTVVLHDDIMWPNEFEWQPVQQTTEYTVTGALLIDVGVKQAGRRITLQGDARSAWMRYSDVLTLQSWKAIPGAVMTLVLRGVTYSVSFDHEQGAISAQSKHEYSVPAPDDFFVVVLKLIEV